MTFFWNDSIRDSLIATLYWSIGLVLLTTIIYTLLYKSNRYCFIKSISNIIKIFNNDKLNGIYNSYYYYTWTITEENYQKEKKEYLMRLDNLNTNNKNKHNINNLIKFLNIDNYEKIKIYLDRLNDCEIFANENSNVLEKIKKLIKRRENEEVIIYEIIEIIVIGKKIYGFNLPHNYPKMKRIRHNSENQETPIHFLEQKEEFRFKGEKLQGLYVGYWTDPVKMKKAFGSFSFINPDDEFEEIEGKWLGKDKKSGIPINEGSWRLEYSFENTVDYYKNINEGKGTTSCLP